MYHKNCFPEAYMGVLPLCIISFRRIRENRRRELINGINKLFRLLVDLGGGKENYEEVWLLKWGRRMTPPLRSSSGGVSSILSNLRSVIACFPIYQSGVFSSDFPLCFLTKAPSTPRRERRSAALGSARRSSATLEFTLRPPPPPLITVQLRVSDIGNSLPPEKKAAFNLLSTWSRSLKLHSELSVRKVNSAWLGRMLYSCVPRAKIALLDS